MKQIKGWEGLYSVTENGRIWSHKRFVNRLGSPRLLLGHFKKLKRSSGGYVIVELSKKNQNFYKSVHRIVAIAFIQNPLNLPQVNHLNGVKHDNRVENLEWCTNKQNSEHASRTGLLRHHYGEDSVLAKLTNKQVIRIRELHAKQACSIKVLAEKYCIDRSTVSLIVNGKTWKNLL